MSTKFCDFCGAAMGNGEIICSACGHITNDESTAKAQSQYQQPAPLYQQQNPPYQQPMPQYQQPGYINPQLAYMQQDTTPMSIGDYVLMIFLSCIPLAGLVLLLVWAFDSNINMNKRNYARANLIIALVVLGLFIIICIIAGIFAANSPSNYYSNT